MADQGGNIVMREYKKGNWTVSETMVLIEAKKMDDERRMKRSSGETTEGRSKPAELRWKWVEDYCWRKGCLRSQNQCNDKWDNLMRDYKKVRDYERKIAEKGEENLSYWKMEKTERKDNNLPSNMLLQIYEALLEVVEKKGVQRAAAAAGSGGSTTPDIVAGYVVERPITIVQPPFQHPHSAPIPMLTLPLPQSPPPPPQSQPLPPPLPYSQPVPTVGMGTAHGSIYANIDGFSTQPTGFCELVLIGLVPYFYVLEMCDSSDSDTSEYSDSPAKRRRRGRGGVGGGGGGGGNGEGTSGNASASTSHEVGTAISKSASIIAEALQACEEREERRHRDLVSLHERRLKIEESKSEINRQGINGLVDAINKLANSILALASNKNQSSAPK
ncbi:hypothetical protein JRO89_XS06G0187000 [Xanthoceras sorbifolium]|uniref:Myb-like domain-containing protein n=1 Tax=Xanthoceras sorbifolium TaxID=99658 RepID=A0ABQ8HYW9_9ROSI|nr:hypothetical protein JRO89_XS06G0187000 [Xanthoceras sorbifolium]